MRILFLSNYYPPFHIGGYEELCADVAGGLVEKGHQVGILTCNIGKSNNDEKMPNPVYRRLELEVSGPPVLVSMKTLFRNRSRFSRNLRHLDQTLQEFQPQIIMIWGMWNLSKSIAKRLEQKERIIVIYYIADYWPLLPSSMTLHWQSPSKNRITAFPKKVIGNLLLQSKLYCDYDLYKLDFENAICVSNVVKKELVDKRIIPNDSLVINNGIRVEDFPYSNERCFEDGDPRRVYKLLYTGRLSRDKGIEVPIEAAKILKSRNIDISLDIVGGGDQNYLDELMTMIKQYNLDKEIHFCGRKDRKEMAEVYHLHEFLLTPSIWPEPLPRVIFEGMISGCVVIASRIGGIPEVIQNGINGFLFEPGDAKELADIIQNLTEDMELLKSVQKAGKETILMRFSLDRCVDEIENYLYQRVSG